MPVVPSCCNLCVIVIILQFKTHFSNFLLQSTKELLNPVFTDASVSSHASPSCSTNKWSSTCHSTNCPPTSDRKSMTTTSTDTRARCLMKRASSRSLMSRCARYEDTHAFTVMCLFIHDFMLVSTLHRVSGPA